MRTKEFNKIKPYTYVLTRKSDNKKYHGVRFGNIKLGLTPNEDFGKKYFGSSTGRFCKDFKLNPKNYFFKLIWSFDQIEEALFHEKKFNKQILKNKNWENKNAFPAIQYDVHPLLGKKHSKDSRIKMSNSQKGKKASPETRLKLSKMRKGRKLTKEHIENIRKGNVGKKRSTKTKEKIRLANLGRKASTETKLKMSMMRKGVPKSKKHKAKLKKHLKKFMFKKGEMPWNKGLKGKQVAWNKGKKFSIESRMKMSLSQKGKVPWNKGLKGVMIAWNKGKRFKKNIYATT